MKKSFLLTIQVLFFASVSLAQLGTVDHWEKVIDANDKWRYWVGTSAPDTNWNEKDFNDSAWAIGRGGFGYGDGDDSTIIPATTSIYIRIEFNVKDRNAIEAVLLNSDYDDAYVAYLNSFEVSRKNIGTPWVEPAYNDLADYDSEAKLYQGEEINYDILSEQQMRYALLPGKNVLAIQIHNNTTVSSDLTAIFYLLFGINNTSSDYRTKPSWFENPPMYDDETNIPIVYIDELNGVINDTNKVVSRMRIIWNGKNQVHRFDATANDYDGLVDIKYRGYSTLQFPKKSYSIETQDSAGENNNVTLMGLPKENDWVLYAPYIDKSLIRTYITYNLGRRLKNEYSPRTQFCEVFINEVYFGLYILTEKIKRDKNRVDIKKLNPDEITGEDITGGYILKVDWVDDPSDTFTTVHANKYSGYNDLTFNYHYPKSDEIVQEQKDYIKDWIWKFEDVLLDTNFNDPENGYSNYIDVESFADYFIMNELSKDIDAFKQSVYMYKNHSIDDNKLYMGPLWDYNLTYGNVDYGIEEAWKTEDWLYTYGPNRMFWFPRLLDDPVYQDFVHCRWEYLRSRALATDSVLDLIDESVLEMGKAADRHHFKWKTLGRYVWPNKFVGDTYEEEIDYLKNWVTNRLDWLDENMPGECVLPSSIEDGIEKADEWSIFPNPSKDQINIALMNRNNIQMIQIYNLTGQELLQIQLNGFSSLIQIPINGLTSGGYTVVITKNNGSIESKLFLKE